MGYVYTIGISKFPKQADEVGRRVRVRFLGGDGELQGTIVRSDIEQPWRVIIQLDDGRYILSEECLYSA